MANISAEQALQIPQQLRRQNSDTDTAAQNDSRGTTGNRLLSDDAVTIRLTQNTESTKKIDVNEYKSDLGSDSTFVRETLRNKLAELNLNPGTPLSVSKNLFGQLEIKGPLLQTDIDKIRGDLEKSDAFVESFNRVSQQQPTLNYIDNVVKISRAYGVENSVFNTLVSDNDQFNGLNDIAHRYHALRSNENTAVELNDSPNFSFVVN